MALKGKLTTTESDAKPVLLELGQYRRYHRMGVQYEQGQVYRFTSEQAIVLLNEQDNGKAVWKVFRPTGSTLTPAAQKEASIMDYTQKVIAAKPESDDPYDPRPKSLEIGNEEEIESILHSGDVVTI